MEATSAEMYQTTYPWGEKKSGQELFFARGEGQFYTEDWTFLNKKKKAFSCWVPVLNLLIYLE